MKRIRKIDIHAHATAFPEAMAPYCGSKYRMVSAEEVIAFYDDLDIEMGVLLPISSAEGTCSPLTSEACHFIANQHPDRFIWFCNVDPRAGSNSVDADLTWFLDHYKKLGAKGLGELTANLYADDPMVDNLLGRCAESNLPVIIHISPALRYNYGLVDEMGLPRLEKMLKKHPNLKLIGHSQPFWAEMSATLQESERNHYPSGKVVPGALHRLMRECPNLYCDLSAGSGMNALRRDPENAARFIEEFSDRILYGCDVCATFNRHPYEFNEFLTGMRESGMISEENYAKVVRNNAIDLLNLPLEKA